MNNKHNPYLRLFNRDIEGSPKINALSMAASGLYFRLLNRFNEPPRQGSLALHEWEVHHTWKRSLTQQCLATADKQARLVYFAKYFSRIFQWKSADILKALQELYFFGIVVVEDDRLIQPRMYRDNGFRLEGDTPSDDELDLATGALKSADGKALKEPENEGRKTGKKSAQKNNEKKTQKNNEKKTQKNTATHARGRSIECEYENNNIVNKEDRKENEKEKDKSEKTVQRKNAPVADNPPTIDEVKEYFAERARQGKPFLHVTPDTFFDACEQSGWRLKDGKPMLDWRARVRTFENYRRDKGEPMVNSATRGKEGDPVPAKPPQRGKYRKW